MVRGQERINENIFPVLVFFVIFLNVFLNENMSKGMVIHFCAKIKTGCVKIVQEREEKGIGRRINIFSYIFSSISFKKEKNEWFLDSILIWERKDFEKRRKSGQML